MTAEPSEFPVPLRVLLVDDDAVDRMSVRRALRHAGVDAQVDEAVDALDAMSMLASGEYHVVFLDFNIPHGDGLTLLLGLRRARLAMPVVVLSGQENAEIVKDLLAAGAVDYIPKDGLQPVRLLESLRLALSR
jgi:CheY-like chemotaxis protein